MGVGLGLEDRDTLAILIERQEEYLRKTCRWRGTTSCITTRSDVTLVKGHTRSGAGQR